MNRLSTGRLYLTSGEVGEVFGVSSKTANQWFDSGKLIGYRIPTASPTGCHKGDRRFDANSLFSFAVKHGLPVAGLYTIIGSVVVALTESRLIVERIRRVSSAVDGGSELRTYEDPFAFAAAFSECPSPAEVWLDMSGDRSLSLRVARHLHKTYDTKRIILLTTEGETESDLLIEAGYQPIDREGFLNGGLPKVIPFDWVGAPSLAPQEKYLLAFESA